MLQLKKKILHATAKTWRSLNRLPGEEIGYPLQYSCLENSKDRGAWEDIVHGVAKVGHDLVTKLPPPLYKNIL